MYLIYYIICYTIFFIIYMKDKKNIKNVYLIGIKTSNESRIESIENLQELQNLAKTINLNIINSEIVTIKKINTTYYIGSGKIKELSQKIKELSINTIVTDFELTPSQHRNWEKQTKVEVLDKKDIVLQIFTSRARTKEAILQVSLAKEKNQLSKLKRTWTHLSRQFGKSIRSRGEGEKQLEIDRRLIKDKISFLTKGLSKLKKHRKIQRTKRETEEISIGAIVGYTNVGKSSLLNLLSKNSNISTDNQLFTTLDSTSRLIELHNDNRLILTDTVGFIRKLPHILIEAFKSTLEEIVIANFLIHVVDISSILNEKHIEITNSILSELNSTNKPILMVFNKIDKLKKNIREKTINIYKVKYPNSIFISVINNYGICDLHKELQKYYTEESIEIFDLKIPIDRHDIVSKLHSIGKIVKIKYTKNNIIISIMSSKKYIDSVLNYDKKI